MLQADAPEAARAALEHVTVIAADVIGSCHVKRGMFKSNRRCHLITRFRTIGGIVHVVAILCIEDIVEVRRVFGTQCIEGEPAVLGIFEIIADAIFAIEVVHVPVDPLLDADLFPECENFLESRPRAQMQLREFALVLFFCVLFIEYAVLLVTKVDGEKTVTRSFAVETEGAVRAVVHVLGPPKGIAVIALDTFVTECGMVGKMAIDAVLRELHKVIEVAVFIRFGRNIEIAILLVIAVGAEVTVFAIGDRDSPMRNVIVEIGPLRKKRTGPINLPAMLQSIPLIAMPSILSIHGKWSIRGVHR